MCVIRLNISVDGGNSDGRFRVYSTSVQIQSYRTIVITRQALSKNFNFACGRSCATKESDTIPSVRVKAQNADIFALTALESILNVWLNIGDCHTTSLSQCLPLGFSRHTLYSRTEFALGQTVPTKRYFYRLVQQRIIGKLIKQFLSRVLLFCFILLVCGPYSRHFYQSYLVT